MPILNISTCERLIEEHRQTERELAALEQLLLTYCKPDASEYANSLQYTEALLEEIRALYNGMATALYQHFVVEEVALFSVLSPYRTMMLMTVEHDDLLALQADFQTALEGCLHRNIGPLDLLKAFMAFQTRLKAHIVEEERGIFPLAIDCFEPEERLKSERLNMEVRAAFLNLPTPVLSRPAPQVGMPLQLDYTRPLERPLEYTTLYEREHASVKQIGLQAGAKQALHWVGPHQCVVVQKGHVVLLSQLGEQVLQTGAFIPIDSQCHFAFHAIEDSFLLVFSVWPHPHYTKNA